MMDNDGHHKKSCLSLFARFSEYLDNELEPALSTDIERHARECPPCRVCLETLRRTIALCRQAENLPLPEGLSRRLRLLVENLVRPGSWR